MAGVTGHKSTGTKAVASLWMFRPLVGNQPRRLGEAPFGLEIKRRGGGALGVTWYMKMQLKVPKGTQVSETPKSCYLGGVSRSLRAHREDFAF